MPTKAELEKENKMLVRAVAVYFILTVVFAIGMVFLLAQLVSMNAFHEPVYDRDIPKSFEYAYSTVSEKYISLFDIDSSCILDYREYDGGSVWMDLDPGCLHIESVTYKLYGGV